MLSVLLENYECFLAKIKGAVRCIPYSGFYLRGPNFCEICEVLTSSQILILYSYLLPGRFYSHVNQQQSMLY